MTHTWTAAFRSAPVSPYEPMPLIHHPRAFTDQTLRQVVRLRGSADRLRVRLSNLYGTRPLTIARTRLAAHTTAAAINSGIDIPVTFGGAPQVTIPPGQEAVSDPIDFAVSGEADLAISTYHPESTEPATYHPFALQTGYLTPGDAASDPDLPGAEPLESRFYLTGIDTWTPASRQVVAAFGDSLTDGVGTSPGAHQRYPDLLARHLGTAQMSVINLGIAGNRLLSNVFGESGLARFDRDVLAAPGVTHLVMQLGLNDIGMPGMLDLPHPEISDLTIGLSTLAERARRHGLTPIIATITPFSGAAAAAPGFDSPQSEQARRHLNQWIRSTQAYDAVADLDHALRSPAAPAALHPDYDSGDHIHPNDAGAQAMAATIAKALRV